MPLIQKTRSLWKKTIKSLRLRGVIGSSKHLVRMAAMRLRGGGTYTGVSRREQEHELFDRDEGVETGRLVHLADCTVASSDWVHGHIYAPTTVDEFREAVDAASVEPRDYAFVDIGCGKGKAVILAAEMPFREVLGVEWAPELVEVAKKNLTLLSPDRFKCQRVDVVCADATTYPLPQGDLLVFLNNPFDDALMRRFRAHLEAASGAEARKIWLVYVTPMHADVWDESEVFKLHRRNGEVFAVWHNQSAAE